MAVIIFVHRTVAFTSMRQDMRADVYNMDRFKYGVCLLISECA